MKTLFPVHTQQILALSLVLAISMVGISYGAGGVLSGDGTSESTAYLIEDLADFDVFADPCNSATYWSSGVYTKLACDIDLAGRSYTTAVIAPDTDNTNWEFDGIPFKGVFDGNGHIISNLTIDTVGANNDYLGLFGRIADSGAKIKNLGIENTNITGGTDSDRLGSLCGYNNECTITNCSATGAVTGGNNSHTLGGLCGGNWNGPISDCHVASVITGGDNSYWLGGLCGDNNYGIFGNCSATGSVTGGDNSRILGGLCGRNNEGTIINCYTDGVITGGSDSYSCGGLCGRNDNGAITNCYAAGSVTSGDDSYWLGGLCGRNHSDTITNCYATGSVTGGDYSHTLGGLCGRNNECPITNCYATGAVTGDEYLGGLCGENDGGTIINCYASGAVTGDEYLGGLCGYNDSGTITDCFWDTQTSGMSISDGGTGKTTAQMQTQSTFTSAGWDFVGESVNGTSGIWCMYVDGIDYPQLSWWQFLLIDQADWSLVYVDSEETESEDGAAINSFDGDPDTIWCTEWPEDPPCPHEIQIDLGDFYDICGFRYLPRQDATQNGMIKDYEFYVSNNTDDWGTAIASGTFVKDKTEKQVSFDCASGRYVRLVALSEVNDNPWTTMAELNVLTWPVSEYVNVPDIVNITQAEAEAAITGLGLFVGTVTFSCHDTIPAGVVISQNPQAEVSVPIGSCISFVVSLGIFEGITGSGTESDPYVLDSLTDFDEFADQANAATCWSSGVYTKLTCDLNLTGRSYTTAVIAPDTDASAGFFQGTSFMGIFDGDGHVIRNLTINTAGASNDYLGLFGRILGSGAEVKNLGLENVNITGGYYSDAGCLCGDNDYGTITNCYATGSVIGGGGMNSLGGLCARNEGTIINCYTTVAITGGGGGLCATNYGTIINCYATGAVTDNGYSSGGLCGSNSGGTIINCYATGAVVGSDEDTSYSLGGLCGGNGGTIKNCYATGSVIGGASSNLGGLCGSNHNGTITNCYAAGSVTGGDNSNALGGLCGWNYNSTITNCFWDTQTSGMSYSDGGTGKTTAQMQTQSTFTDAGWDFTNESANGTNQIWQMPTGGGYPVLSNFDGYTPVLLSGNGTEASPYLLSNAAQLGAIYHYGSNACFSLQSDIDLTGIQWSTAIVPVFGGCFDGNGYVIYNMNIEGGDYLGLFGAISGSAAEIKNLGLENVNIVGGDYSDYLGGLCGKNGDWKWPGGTITNCYATGSVTGGDNSCSLGGLCGSNGDCHSNGGTITNCYATGSVTGGDGSWDIGGLCGFNGNTIANCYATSSVIGGGSSYSLGGLCGSNGHYYDRGRTISNCYATGSVTGGEYLGGLCGKNSGGTITDCFWDMETSGMTTNYGGTGLLTQEMKESFYYSANNWAGDIWTIDEGNDYPHLTWENAGGEAIIDPIVTMAGSGTTEYPWIIESKDDFLMVCSGSFFWDKHYILNTDIDLSGTIYKRSLLGYDDDNSFTGSFNGNGHIIRNLTIDGSFYLGMFGYIGRGALVSNLGLENVSVTGTGNYVGGLVGYNYYSSVTNSYSAGPVSSAGNYVGGLVGYDYYGSITNSYSTDSVSGNQYVGGLLGYKSFRGSVTNSYSTGSVSGNQYVGGLCGDNDGRITNCFWDVETSGMATSSGGTGKTTAEMQTESTFTDAGWDFTVVPVWHMPFEATGYPMLGWQRDIPGDFTGRYGVDMVDFAVLADTWFLSSGQAGYNDLCDLMDDDTININDLAIFAENWLCN